MKDFLNNEKFMFICRVSSKKDSFDGQMNKNKPSGLKGQEKDNMEIDANIEHEEVDGNNEINEIDNVIFNNDAVPNHIDIIDFNDGDEENMEPEIILGNENLNNVRNIDKFS